MYTHNYCKNRLLQNRQNACLKKRGLKKSCWGSVALKLKLTDIVENTRKEFLEYCSYKTVKQMKSQ